jgi:pyruvate,water dikinase
MEQELAAIAAGDLSMQAFAERTMESMSTHLDAFFATLIAAQIARWGMRRMFRDEGPEVRDQLIHLERALPGNITIEMGLAMARLAQFEEIRGCESGAAFAAQLKAGDVSPEFLAAWDAFMARFGFRSPMEMDPGAVRYYEQPARFFEQLRTLSQHTDAAQAPQAIFERARAQRERAYDSLLQVAREKGKRRARRFARFYGVWLKLARYRETPKYTMSRIADLFRRRVLAAALSLVDDGRLDSPEQVFDLTIDELDRALAEPWLDLRALAEANTRYLRKFRHVREFPRIVDSRGKILRAPRGEAREGELVGQPISPGVVRGPVKVLHEPDEKPVLPGDILVARATDPGWTPLFLNAGGIVLEVGGMLQHGALVAREYGKPCISGLEHATETLLDGQMVEMDGASGVVRLA